VTIGLARDEQSRVAVNEALRALAERGVVELLVEGGGTVHGSMLDARAADAIVCYIAPVLFGGRDATPAFGGTGVGALSAAHRLGPLAVERLGEDLKLSAEFVHVHRDHHSDR
jgi:diaminohydroxyphosphoribosylaminopyrimidine deaminase/5-amino-6-(5-phosphoribosylamino)uracil reductase